MSIQDLKKKSYKPKLFLWIKQQETMSLQQLCSSSGNKRISSSNAPFIPPTIQTQEVYDAKFSQQPMERCASQTSTLSFSRDICRICHCEGDSETPLIAPCYCAGSLRYVHQGCLQQWIKSSDTKCCELCKFPFIMHSKVKTFRKWERLDMSGVERRKIMFSVLFHIIAITCVVWSLYVLIERTSQEVQNGELEWPFWTKLIVVAIGFTGSIVFMYVQCKMYIHLCRRWRAFNRVIYIQNAPEKIILDEVEMSKLQADFQSEAQKPFLALAVITSTSGTTVINTSGTGIINTSHGGCCTTSSSPPGALWSEETSPQLTTLSCYNSEISNHHCRPEEGDSLISRTEPPSRSDARTKPVYDSTRRWFKETRQGSPRRNFRKSREKPLPSVTSSLGLSRNVQQEQAIAALSSSESSDAETPQLDGP